MRSKKSYRVSGRFKEILDVLQGAKRSRENYLWRAQKRQLIPIVIHHIYPEQNTIEVALVKFGSVSLNVGDELYLKLDTRDSAFKTKVQSVSAVNFILEFPDEMVLAENRSETRQYFHPEDGKVVQVKKIKNYVSSLSERSFSLGVSDISQKGLALILPAQNSASLNVNDRIALEEMGTFRIHPAIIGEVVFKVPYQGGVKIGIHLDKKIPKATYDRFIIREKLFSIADATIVKDEKFRKDVHERMGVMTKTLILKRNLLKLFDRLDMRQPEHQYLRQHIQLLCEVMCGLGTNLGWVSEKTMDKLLYVAFLHDARYFSTPKLAKIQSKKEFEKLKKALSEDERNVFLEGPVYAAELARQDIDSYPDVAKILIQQKELPDGSGFPYGITTSQFIPLSCLFIVSHYFVDYVLNTQDWSVMDFVKTHQKFLKGIYFQKVFQAMKG